MDRVTERQVPPIALLFSLLCLWIPVASSSLLPAWTHADVGILLWLLALVPAFLLSYYRGWTGASLALAGGMAAFSLAQLIVVVTGSPLPRPEILLGVVAVLVVVALGSGSISTLFHRSLDRAREMALTDPGTLLPNRRQATLHLERAFAAAERGAPLSVVIFDLDHFKRVNDRFGHAAGDRALERFAEILRRETRGMNLAARFGGEEFISVLETVDGAGAVTYAERVRQKLEEERFSWGSVTVSAGVAEHEPGMTSPDVLVAAADQALYRAKSRGRNRTARLARQGRARSSEPARPNGIPTGAVMTGGEGERVLVVDDDPQIARSVSRLLRRMGYSALEAHGTSAALEIAGDLGAPVDLVLTDVVMPEMSGFRLVEMLEERQGGVRAVYMSGYEHDEVAWAGVPGSVRSFLPKPLEPDVLGRTVRRALDLEPETEGEVEEEGEAWQAAEPPRDTPTGTMRAGRGLAEPCNDTLSSPAS